MGHSYGPQGHIARVLRPARFKHANYQASPDRNGTIRSGETVPYRGVSTAIRIENRP